MVKATGTNAPNLPLQQLMILSVCRFAEPVALTSVFPYLPEMIESFHVPENEVAKWAGVTSAVFSLAQCLTGIPWGRASDRFGRKPVILTGLLCTMGACIFFGFSNSLAWAIAARAAAGLSNGNVGIIRTTVAEMVPEKALQPRAFSVMPLIWTIGSIFGPAFGGALANPAKRYPHLFGKNKFFLKFPYALPNLIACVFFITGLITGFLFLRETLETKQHKRDYGLILGKALTSCPSRQKKNALKWSNRHEDDTPLLIDEEGLDESSTVRRPTIKYSPPGWKEVFSPQSNINLLVYTLLAMHSVAFDQLLPIFMHHPPQNHRDNLDVHLPFKFSGGFGIDSGRIGLLFMFYGVFGMFIQFLVFPPLAHKYGVLNCLKACSITFPIIYMLTPFTALCPTPHTKEVAMFGLMLMKSWTVIFAFPCSTILLTNSANSLRILGTLNGVATSISAIGRATGPALSGAAFSLGVKIGYVIIPWWFLAFIAALGAIPVFSLVEMDGFSSREKDPSASGSGSSIISTDEDSSSSGSDLDLPLPPDKSSSKARIIPALDGGPEPAVEDESNEFTIDDSGPFLQKTGTHGSHSRGRGLSKRRMSSPIGLRVAPRTLTARRFSTNLGATRSGFGTGGTSLV